MKDTRNADLHPQTQQMPGKQHVIELHRISDSANQEQTSVVTKSLNIRDSYRQYSNSEEIEKDGSNLPGCYSGQSFAISGKISPKSLAVKKQQTVTTEFIPEKVETDELIKIELRESMLTK